MTFRFDDFEIDTETFELRQNGVSRHVEPLVFDLLCYLCQNSGRVIGRDELIHYVWKGRIVSDATVSSCIKSLRKALADNSERYIRTVRGRGFQFTGRVTMVERPGRKDLLTQHRSPEIPRNESGFAPDPALLTDRLSLVPERPILAVLPFANLTSGFDEYFADGLTEDIIAKLSRFRDLLVIGRTSTFQFKRRAVDLAELRAKLHANYVLEGSVRRAAGRVRITAQLVDATTGVHLWADHYDREMEDIFAVQDEVTCMIAAALGVKIQDVATQRATRKKPAELDAYDRVLRARRYTTALSDDVHADARDLLEQAVALDPAYADAHALLANVYLAEHRFNANPRPNPVERALKMAQIAVGLDPQNAYAHCWLGIVHFFRRENDQFEAEAQRALSLNPNDPETLADIGHYLAFMGEFERGVELSRKARALNPLHPGWYYFSAARYHYHRREYRKVLADVQRVSMPHFYWTHLLNAAALGQLQQEEAHHSLEQIFRLKPDFSARAELQKWNAEPRDLEHLMAGLQKAGLREGGAGR